MAEYLKNQSFSKG